MQIEFSGNVASMFLDREHGHPEFCRNLCRWFSLCNQCDDLCFTLRQIRHLTCGVNLSSSVGIATEFHASAHRITQLGFLSRRCLFTFHEKSPATCNEITFARRIAKIDVHRLLRWRAKAAENVRNATMPEMCMSCPDKCR